MDLDQLRGFYYVAKLGSFTEAAERLFLTQPAISLQVKALEARLGEQLFDRVGRSVRLTHSGELILRQVEEVLSKLDELETLVRELKGVERGKVSIGTSDTTGIYFLPALLQRFRAAHPGIDLSIKSLMSREVIQKLNDRELDLGIVTLSKPSARLESIPLFSERFVCIAAEDHAFANRRSIGPQEAGTEPLILLDRGSLSRQVLDDFFSDAGVTPQVVMELSNFEVIKRYVASGLGLSFVPEAVVDPERDGVSVLPLIPEVSIVIGATYRKDRKLGHATSAFLALAKAHFESAMPGAIGLRRTQGRP